MKKMLKAVVAIASLSALTHVAFAAIPGAYIGLGVGPSKAMTPDEFLFDTSQGSLSRELGGLGGRVFGGYNFNEYFGLEAGYARYATSTYKGNDSITGQNSSIKYKMSALDLVGKAYLPISDTGLDVYGLGGIAYASNQTQYNDGGVAMANGVTAPEPGTHTHSKIRPIIGVGGSYALTSALTTSVEFSHIQGSGDLETNPSAIPSANMATLNLIYNFG